MTSVISRRAFPGVESLHVGALGVAAVALFAGLTLGGRFWVDTGVSTILLLPVLRLATTVLTEASGRRFVNALMGVAILAFILLSRRIS